MIIFAVQQKQEIVNNAREAKELFKDIADYFDGMEQVAEEDLAHGNTPETGKIALFTH